MDNWTVSADSITYTPDSITYTPYTTNRINFTPYVTTDPFVWNRDKYITENKMEEYLRKIYKIVSEHTPIDITEDEFMELMEE